MKIFINEFCYFFCSLDVFHHLNHIDQLKSQTIDKIEKKNEERKKFAQKINSIRMVHFIRMLRYYTDLMLSVLIIFFVDKFYWVVGIFWSRNKIFLKNKIQIWHFFVLLSNVNWMLSVNFVKLTIQRMMMPWNTIKSVTTRFKNAIASKYLCKLYICN